MATPTSYTYETFGDYLKNEVLMEAADSLGWGDIQEFEPSISKRLIFKGGSYEIEPSPIYLKGLQSITLSDGNIYYLQTDLEIGDIYFDGATPNIHPAAGVYFDKVLSVEKARIRNPYYDTMTDEVLHRMGLTNITQINSTNILLFRLLGRVEVLRRAMQNTASDYTYLASGDTVSRQQVYQQLTRLFQHESERLSRLNFEFNAPEIVIDVPQESQSQSTGIKVIW